MFSDWAVCPFQTRDGVYHAAPNVGTYLGVLVLYTLPTTSSTVSIGINAGPFSHSATTKRHLIPCG
jgi:hypothetical protein